MTRSAFVVALLVAFPAHAASASDVAPKLVTVACRLQQGNAVCVLPKVTTLTGEEATVIAERVTISIRPTIEHDGTVTVKTKLSTGEGPNENIMVLPGVTTFSGQPAHVAVGDVMLIVTPVLEPSLEP